MKKPLLRWISPALVGVMLSGPAFAGAAIAKTPTHATTPAQTTSQPAAPVAASTRTSDATNYQAREAASAGLEQWAGGAGVSIYLGGSALALVVLLLVLLIIF
ncbi:MAG TPA: hypothetical protein VGG33_12760 [Polyangia bacterium]